MSTRAKTKKKIMPRPQAKKESLQESLRRINEQYGETLAKLAK